MIDDIDGTFCLVVLDRRIGKCFVVTDIGGVINTYIRKAGNTFFISTSMLALAKAYPVSLDKQAILLFLRSGMFFDETTYFNEIIVLKPATIYQYDIKSNKFINEKYWSVPQEVNDKISFKEAASKITTTLKHIIDNIPDDEAIYDFTGGYDSRFVLALAYGNGEKRGHLNAFFFGPPNSREAKIVEQNCLNLGITYNNYLIHDDWTQNFYDYILESNNLCDGLENACVYAPILLTQKWKKRSFKYSVHGLFGELFRQRTWEFEFGKRGKKIPAHLSRLIKYRNLSDDFDKSIFSDKYLRIIDDVPNKLLETYKNTNSILDQKAPNTLQLDNIYFSQRARRWGGRNITTANQIIQPICPMWFRKPLEISLSLPPKYKIKCKLMRYIVENESPAFANEKMITGTPFVLMNFVNIHRFIPGITFFGRKAIRKFSQVFFNRTIWGGLTTPDYKTGEWFRQTLKDPRCQDLLNYEKMLSKSFYDERGFNEFIQRANASEFHFYGQLGNIITAELTLRAANIKRN